MTQRVHVTRATPDDSRHAGLGTPTLGAVLASNMVGTGVFTSLGLQARDLHTPAALLLWVTGGEYVYLGRAFSQGCRWGGPGAAAGRVRENL